MIKLPRADFRGKIIEDCIRERMSKRYYRAEPLKIEEVAQILWAAQGMINKEKRSAPSAGATYPLKLYAMCGNVDGLEKGLYLYLSQEHALEEKINEDLRKSLCKCALNQEWIEKAALVLIFVAVYKRTTMYYGERGTMYVHIETGHSAQNVYLECVSMGLGTVAVGAFHPGEVKKLLLLSKEEEPLYIMPIGRI
jgi:SagB-type dehydrogenase family enzyme